MKLMKNITKSVVLAWLFCYFFGVIVSYVGLLILGWPVGFADMFALLLFAFLMLIACGVISVLFFLIFGVLLRLYVKTTRTKAWEQHS